MPSKKAQDAQLPTLSSARQKNAARNDVSLKSGKSAVSRPNTATDVSLKKSVTRKKGAVEQTTEKADFSPSKDNAADSSKSVFTAASPEELTYAERRKKEKKTRLQEKDQKLIYNDRWLLRKGHLLTYAGVFLFTLVLYFRPYELIPALADFSSLALIIAIATFIVYLPTQFSSEGNLTMLSTEVKCILFLTAWALLTIPIAKSPADAWGTFNVFIKVVMMFVVMVNTLRTRARLKGLIWLAVGVGVMLSYQAIDLYQSGDLKTDGTRVSVDVGGMFGNTNDMALHFVIVIPLAVALGISSKNYFHKVLYFVFSGMMVIGVLVTQSRGGFLGLIAACGILAWKLGKKQRLKIAVVSLLAGVLIIAFAPGDYGTRILSIFNPTLDASGSSDQRSELLKQSILVTLRNPQGIGIGNFPIVGVQNLQTHNAYTQVSSELGILALIAFVIMIVSPFRKLAAIERQMSDREDFSWIYIYAVGIQASLVGYMVSSFFLSVAYGWFAYYPIAFAICLRRIYQTEYQQTEEKGFGKLGDFFKRQIVSDK